MELLSDQLRLIIPFVIALGLCYFSRSRIDNEFYQKSSVYDFAVLRLSVVLVGLSILNALMIFLPEGAESDIGYIAFFIFGIPSVGLAVFLIVVGCIGKKEFILKVTSRFFKIQ